MHTCSIRAHTYLNTLCVSVYVCVCVCMCVYVCVCVCTLMQFCTHLQTESSSLINYYIQERSLDYWGYFGNLWTCVHLNNDIHKRDYNAFDLRMINNLLLTNYLIIILIETLRAWTAMIKYLIYD